MPTTVGQCMRMSSRMVIRGACVSWWASRTDRKSTRLNSSHLVISYAVFCLQKQGLVETLRDCDGYPGPCMIKQYNKRDGRNWDTIRKFLALHFKFATGPDTPYWQACRADTD